LPLYPLPSFLAGVVSAETYQRWILHHGHYLFWLDKKRNFPCALNGSSRLYRDAIAQAAERAGPCDPYTGDAMRWDLVDRYPHTRQEFDSLTDAMCREFALLPVADHIDPRAEKLAFEICSWQINTAKCSSTPEEFVELCKAVLDHCSQVPGNAPRARMLYRSFKKYNLPDFLRGRISLEKYRRWLRGRGATLFARDRKKRRPYAMISNGGSFYSGLIHTAVCQGAAADPFTGRPLAWELISTKDDFSNGPHDIAFMKKFAQLPTVDHIDPMSKTLAFEICSFEINKCKASLDPEEFVAQCKKIVEYRGTSKTVERTSNVKRVTSNV